MKADGYQNKESDQQPARNIVAADDGQRHIDDERYGCDDE